MPRHFTLEAERSPAFAAWLRQRGLPRSSHSRLSATPKTFSKWPKETKPGLDSVMRDVAIYNRAGHVTNEMVYGFGDDFKDHFQQLAMASSEPRKQSHVFLS